jgi:hypothetical protein
MIFARGSIVIQISGIQGHIKMRPQFRARRFGYGNKLMELRALPPLKTLSQIGHDGNRGSLHLGF